MITSRREESRLHLRHILIRKGKHASKRHLNLSNACLGCGLRTEKTSAMGTSAYVTRRYQLVQCVVYPSQRTRTCSVANFFTNLIS